MKTMITRNVPRKRLGQTGMTIPELMIAALVFAIVATAGFRFYARMHQATMAQDTISEIQHQGRNTLRDMRKTVRLAGYNLTSHSPYEIKPDTLAIYYSMTQAVDTVLYYLTEFNTTEYSKITNHPTGTKVYRLMRKINNQQPAVYADFVNTFNVVQINAESLALTMTVQAERQDDKYTENNGYRKYTQGERVTMRNVNL